MLNYLNIEYELGAVLLKSSRKRYEMILFSCY